MTPREEAEDHSVSQSCEVTSEQADEGYAVEEDKADEYIDDEEDDDISDGVMTFDIGLHASNNNCVEY